MPLCEKLRLRISLAGRLTRKPSSNPASCIPSPPARRSTPIADIGADCVAHALEKPLSLDRLQSPLRSAAQASGPPPKVVPRSVGRERRRHNVARTAAAPAQGKPLPSALAVVSMSGRHAMETGRQTPRRNGRRRIALRQRSRGRRSHRSLVGAAPARNCAVISNAPADPLHGLDDDRRGVSIRSCALNGAKPRRAE